MSKNKLYVRHVFASFLFLAVLINLLFLAFDYIEKIFYSPGEYIKSNLGNTDLQFYFIFASLIVIVVLLSYIFYLLLTLNSRSELIALEKTKSLALSKGQFKKLY